jgi:hypothetical protein
MPESPRPRKACKEAHVGRLPCFEAAVQVENVLLRWPVVKELIDSGLAQQWVHALGVVLSERLKLQATREDCSHAA